MARARLNYKRLAEDAVSIWCDENGLQKPSKPGPLEDMIVRLMTEAANDEKARITGAVKKAIGL